MTRSNLEIQIIRDQLSYGPMPYGNFSGQPTVSVKLSSSESNAVPVTSLESQMLNWNWKRKLHSGYARLRIHGDNPLGEEHRDALEFLFDTLNPRFVDIELKDKYVREVPPRFFKRKLDTYTFFIDITKDELRYDEDVMAKITETSNSHGDAQYIFKVDSMTNEDDIKDFRQEYNLYSTDIWLFPKGRKVSTISDNQNIAETMAKRNTWNVSPRLDVISNYEEDDG